MNLWVYEKNPDFGRGLKRETYVYRSGRRDRDSQECPSYS